MVGPERKTLFLHKWPCRSDLINLDLLANSMEIVLGNHEYLNPIGLINRQSTPQKNEAVSLIFTANRSIGRTTTHKRPLFRVTEIR
jgi:hypothetical protein